MSTKNIIAIDPSLNSTAIFINGKPYAFSSESLASGKKKLSKWFELSEIEGGLNIISVEDTHKSTNYTDDETIKLIRVNNITDSILLTINENIDKTLETIVYMEGYSYSSTAGPLIDLVTFSTVLRLKLINTGFKMVIYSPSEVKQHAASLTYPQIKKGKVVQYRNNEGVSGGHFKKHEMYKCITENNNFTDVWSTFIKNNANVILDMKSIPKPIDDVNDAFLIYNYALKINNYNNLEINNDET